MITRPIDRLGRLLLPEDLREELGIKPGAEVTISIDGNGLLVKPSQPVCTFCKGEVSDVGVQVRGKFVCGNCVRAIHN